jgi:signal transduction histidine kinase
MAASVDNSFPSLDILLVEDSAADRELVRQFLHPNACVRFAGSARQARQALEESIPDVVLLDYRLPDAEGTSLLPLFAPGRVPVIMLTGMEAAEVVVTAMKGGAQDYLVKNQLSEEGLQRVILNAIEKARLLRAVEEQREELGRQAAALERKNREVSLLASALTLAEQEERRRVATLLHDHVQQLLFGAKLGLSGVAELDDVAGRRRRTEHVERILDEAIASTRNLAVELTPPVMDREELEVGLKWIVERMAAQHGLEVRIEAHSRPCIVPARELRVLLLQFVRELLFNVVKHSGVRSAIVRLQRHGDVCSISVIDDGCGFEPASIAAGTFAHLTDPVESTGFGLYSVRERLELLGGRLEIRSAHGRGCHITIHSPVIVGRPIRPRGPDLFSGVA